MTISVFYFLKVLDNLNIVNAKTITKSNIIAAVVVAYLANKEGN